MKSRKKAPIAKPAATAERTTNGILDYKLSRRGFLSAATATVASFSLMDAIVACGGAGNSPGNSGPPRTLVVGTNGGDYYKDIYAACLQPFEKKYNAKILPIFADGNTLLARAVAEKNNPSMDAVVTFQGAWLIGQAEGLWEKINYNNIPNINDVYDFLKDPGGLGPYVNLAAWGIVYNKDKISTPPPSFQSLWESQYKHQLMIGGIYHWQIHLTAFAFAWTKDQHQIDTAFQKTKELMPNVSAFYGLTSDAQSKFQQGLGTIATWYSNAAQRLRMLGLPLEFQTPAEGAFLYPTSYQALKGTKKLDLVEQMIGQFYDPQSCIDLAKTEGYIPANKTVKLDPTLQKQLLTYDQVLGTHQWDWNLINTSQNAWLTRWNSDIKPLLNP